MHRLSIPTVLCTLSVDVFASCDPCTTELCVSWIGEIRITESWPCPFKTKPSGIMGSCLASYIFVEQPLRVAQGYILHIFGRSIHHKYESNFFAAAVCHSDCKQPFMPPPLLAASEPNGIATRSPLRQTEPGLVVTWLYYYIKPSAPRNWCRRHRARDR